MERTTLAVEALARVAELDGVAARVAAVADGFISLGWGSTTVAAVTAPRTVTRAWVGGVPYCELPASSPDALAASLLEDAPDGWYTIPLRAGSDLVGVVAVPADGSCERDDPVTALYVRAVAATLGRDLRIARAASSHRHDLRSPLTVIMGWCEFLTETADEATIGTAETILRQAARLNGIIDEFAAESLGGTAASAERL